ncbi:MAG: FMN-binding negative transcriptional regulator [Xanthobacteraceae bacterium]
MHTPLSFKTDRATSFAFAEARGFGLACAYDGRAPMASPVPFCIDYAGDGTPHVSFHLARNNPLIGLADNKSHWLMAVAGADAYVSADWYVSPDQVPTWLYQAVHLSGPVKVMPAQDLPGHLDRLSEKFETRLAPKRPWTSAKMTAGRLKAMQNGIVGLVMTVDDIHGSFKLNQHKSDADHVAIANVLASRPDTSAQTLAERMVALRPQLDYNTHVANSGAAD